MMKTKADIFWLVNPCAICPNLIDFFPLISIFGYYRDEINDKGLFQAARDIGVGDVFIVEKPYAAVLLPDHYNTHCHHCFYKFYVWVP